MSEYPPFARGHIANKLGLDGEEKGVDEMLQGTFSTDREGLNGVVASSEMNSFIKVLQIPISFHSLILSIEKAYGSETGHGESNRKR